MTAQHLAGVRVIDCSAGLAGSVCTLMLAEAGAEVVKVEPPGGDPRRGSAAFAVWNRSKRSLALDIRGGGRARFDALVAGADMLVHDLPDDAVADLGLAPEALAARAPRLIACRVRGLPEGLAEGPLPVEDDIVLAAMGILSEQPALNREGPAYVRFPLGSWCAAWLAAVGVTARLFAMRRGGAAGPVDTSLLQGAMVPLMMLWRQASTPTDSLDARIDKATLPSIFECADGVWLHLMRNPDGTPLMQAAFEAMGPEGVAAANAGWPPHFRYVNWGANVAAFRSRPSREWLEHLWAHDVAVQSVVPMGALYGDAQAAANDYVVAVDDPDLGLIRQPGHPVTLDPPARMRGPAPALDEARDDPALWSPRVPGPAAPGPDPAGRRLLEGVRVVDFGNYLAGPLTAMILADLGADVVKVEPPAGDPLRANESAFLGCQRGKRSIALDLAHPDARAVVERLVRRADVVQHNLRMPSATRFGLDPAALQAINPALVYAHVSAYGPRGPRRDWPGYDQLFQAQTGWELANAGEGNRPTWLRFGMMDHLCALSCAWGILLALLRRAETDEGGQVAASLLGASLLTMSERAMRPDGSLTPPGPALDRDQTGLGPGRRLARCADGWVFLSGPDGDAPSDAALAALGADAALAMLRARGFRAVRVREDQGAAFLNDPEKVDRGLVARYRHPVYGELRHPGAFWTIPDAPPRLDRAPPAFGEHGRAVLAELGFGDAEIAALADRGVVRLPETAMVMV